MPPTIDYWSAAWCAPCKTLKPKVRALCEANGWSLHEHDLDKEPDAALALSILGVPTLFLHTESGAQMRLNSDAASPLNIKKAMQR